jgi:FkbM family methyltransferase
MRLKKERGPAMLVLLFGLVSVACEKQVVNLTCDCPPSKFESGTYYSQFYEDYILAYVFRDYKTGFYVDVGANDPNISNVTKYFYDRGWRGVNIEPLPEEFKKIVQARTRDKNYNVGISNTETTLTFYQAPLGALDQFSTFDKAEADNLTKKSGIVFKELSVPVTTLDKILQKANLPEINFISIDVEGFEKQVIESINFSRYKPSVLCIEATEPSTESPSYQAWEDMLIKNNYVFAMFDGLNRYYVHKDLVSSLLPRFIFIDMCVKKSKLKRQVKLNGYKHW